MLGFTLSHQEKESGSGSSQLDEQEDVSAKAVVVAHHQVHRQTQEQLYWNVVTVNNRYGERVWVPASIRPQHRLDFASQLSSITYGSMMVDGHRVHMPRVIMDYKVKKQEIETAHQVSLNCTGFWSYIFFCLDIPGQPVQRQLQLRDGQVWSPGRSQHDVHSSQSCRRRPS